MNDLTFTFSGKRNYRYFYLFLVSLAFHCVFIFVCALTHLVLESKDKNNSDNVNKMQTEILQLFRKVFKPKSNNNYQLLISHLKNFLT